jgi:hypothetical protein
MKTTHDDGLEWLREVRRRIAKRFAYDPHKQAAYLRQRQQQAKRRLYQRKDELVAVK